MTSLAGTPPTLDASHFVCPHCGVDAHQRWLPPEFPHDPKGKSDPALKRASCVTCEQHSYWVHNEMAWPRPQLGELPNEGLSGEMLELYNEARSVAPISPRSAAALLRLLVDKLVAHLGEAEGKLHDRIGKLAEKGDITARTVDGLDAVRLSGNNALHAGQIDTEGGDDEEVVMLLFTIVNTVVDNAITLPRRIKSLVGTKGRTGVPEPPTPEG